MLVSPLIVVLLGQLQPLPPNLVALDSDEGRKLLVESKANRDFFALSSQFVTQQSTSFCGVASTVMVLNALPIAAPEAKELGTWRTFTQNNVFNPELSKLLPAEKAEKGGLTIDEVVTLFEGNHAEAKGVFASESSVERFRDEVKQNLAAAGDFMLVDFFRGDLKQDTGAHWSPIAAYNEAEDRILVLDVARFRYPPYWAKTDELFAAMNTRDLDSGKSRGWVSAKPASGAPARITAPPIGGKLLPKLIGAVVALLLLGALMGALITRRILRRVASVTSEHR